MTKFLAEPRLKGSSGMTEMARHVLMLCADGPATIPASPMARFKQWVRRRAGAMQRDRSAAARWELSQNPEADKLFRSHNTVMLELKFRNEFKELDFSSAEIDALWDFFVVGVREQRELVKQKSLDGIRIGPETENINMTYSGIAGMMRTEGKLSHDGKLALWSGGFAVSEYATGLGYVCLESSRIGALLQRDKLYFNEQSLFGLWNYLSAEFVNQLSQTDIHMFVRSFDRGSVMFRIEYPRLLDLKRQHKAEFRILWHVLVGDSNQPDELKVLNRDGKLTSETRASPVFFETPEVAEDAMRRFYDGLPKEESMKLKNKERILSTSFQKRYQSKAA